MTIDDIAESAAFSRATIYLYFKNKQEVYTGVLLRDLDQMISGLTNSFLRTDTVRNNLFRMSTSYMNFSGFIRNISRRCRSSSRGENVAHDAPGKTLLDNQAMGIR